MATRFGIIAVFGTEMENYCLQKYKLLSLVSCTRAIPIIPIECGYFY